VIEETQFGVERSPVNQTVQEVREKKDCHRSECHVHKDAEKIESGMRKAVWTQSCLIGVRNRGSPEVQKNHFYSAFDTPGGQETELHHCCEAPVTFLARERMAARAS
jgi:hypothetical protein